MFRTPSAPAPCNFAISWRLAFLINIPIGIAIVAIAELGGHAGRAAPGNSAAAHT